MSGPQLNTIKSRMGPGGSARRPGDVPSRWTSSCRKMAAGEVYCSVSDMMGFGRSDVVLTGESIKWSHIHHGEVCRFYQSEIQSRVV